MGDRQLKTVRERTDLSFALLRVRGGDAALPRLADAIGITLPSEPNTTSSAGAVRACWMAPGEWLLVSEDVLPLERLAGACAGVLHHVSDVSDGRVAFEITGEGARDVVAKACSLDLHERAFAPGRCAQSLFAQVHVFIVRQGEAFLVIADAAHAVYLRDWFADAMIEYRV